MTVLVLKIPCAEDIIDIFGVVIKNLEPFRNYESKKAKIDI